MRVILTVVALAGAELGAQSTPEAALSLPLGGTMMCQAIPDPEGWILEFTDSVASFSKRESTLSFDTNGNPLTILVLAIGRAAEGKPVAHLVVVRFSPSAEGATTSVNGYDPELAIPLLRKEDTIENLPKGWKRATSQEVFLARALALDFWKRRCGKDLTPPRPAPPPVTD